MANPLYESMMQKQQNNGPFGLINNLITQIQQLKSTGIDPNQKIQEMLNSGQVSQEQYNSAVQRAQQLQQLLGHK